MNDKQNQQQATLDDVLRAISETEKEKRKGSFLIKMISWADFLIEGRIEIAAGMFSISGIVAATTLNLAPKISAFVLIPLVIALFCTQVPKIERRRLLKLAEATLRYMKNESQK